MEKLTAPHSNVSLNETNVTLYTRGYQQKQRNNQSGTSVMKPKPISRLEGMYSEKKEMIVQAMGNLVIYYVRRHICTAFWLSMRKSYQTITFAKIMLFSYQKQFYLLCDVARNIQKVKSCFEAPETRRLRASKLKNNEKTEGLRFLRKKENHGKVSCPSIAQIRGRQETFKGAVDEN